MPNAYCVNPGAISDFGKHEGEGTMGTAYPIEHHTYDVVVVGAAAPACAQPSA